MLKSFDKLWSWTLLTRYVYNRHYRTFHLWDFMRLSRFFWLHVVNHPPLAWSCSYVRSFGQRICSLCWRYLGIVKILFQVGRGFLRPKLDKIRSDTPRACKRLIVDCINKNRDDRPLFPKVRSGRHGNFLCTVSLVITVPSWLPTSYCVFLLCFFMFIPRNEVWFCKDDLDFPAGFNLLLPPYVVMY